MELYVMDDAVRIAHLRSFDPGRGAFDPVRREPVQDRERNPRGTRHINKTRQDHMPVDRRERVAEAKRQAGLRRAGA